MTMEITSSDVGAVQSAGISAGYPGHTGQDAADFSALMEEWGEQGEESGRIEPSAISEYIRVAQAYLMETMAPPVGDLSKLPPLVAMNRLSDMQFRALEGMTVAQLVQGIGQSARKTVDQILQKQG